MDAMSGSVVDREEIELMMWALADIRAEVISIGNYLMGDDDEEEAEDHEP